MRVCSFRRKTLHLTNSLYRMIMRSLTRPWLKFYHLDRLFHTKLRILLPFLKNLNIVPTRIRLKPDKPNRLIGEMKLNIQHSVSRTLNSALNDRPQGPGNSEFCFPKTLNVPRGEAERNIEVEGKQNSALFPEGPCSH